MSDDAFFDIFAARRPEGAAAVPCRLDDAGWQRTVELALRHKCAPMLRERLRLLGLLDRVPEPVRQRLAQIARRNAARNLKRFHQLAELGARLDRDVPLIVLKGGRLARTHYRDVSLRAMVDVDVLARPAQFARAAAALRDLGYVQDAWLSDEFYEGHQHDAPYVKDGMSVELHRSLLPAAAPFAVDPAGLWARATASGLAGLLYLSAEDQLLHLCLHAGYSHELLIGLYAFVDIAQMCDDPALDWNIVIGRAWEWRAGRCVYLMLKLAERLAAARVPAAVEELRPPDFAAPAVRKAADAVRAGLDRRRADAGHFANLVAGYSTLQSWRKLPLALRRRFLRPAEKRARWSPAEGTSWYAQLRPIFAGLAALLYSRRQWLQVIARVRGKRLRRWMEQPL